MTADLEALRALATTTRDALSAASTHPEGPCHGYEAAAALLLACDEIAALRATLARMPHPIADLTAAAHRALRTEGSRHWIDLSPTEQATLTGYHRACLDYLAGGDGNGTIYSAGPNDPPPTQPGT